MDAYIQAAKGLVLLAFLGVCGYFVWNYDHMSAQVEQIAPLQTQVATLQKQQQTLAQELVTRDQLAAAVRDARQQVVTRIETVKTNDPQARAYLDERIPDSLRRAHLNHEAAAVPVPATDGN